MHYQLARSRRGHGLLLTGLEAHFETGPGHHSIGESRDSETTQIALSAAETGHLGLITLHMLDATETVNRMIELFSPHK
jgi:Tfp pilus assembly pilus retraction ATPase PilT